MKNTFNEKVLMDLIHSTERFSLVNLLNEEYFDYEHIPASINIPLKNLTKAAPKLLKDKGELIILYCGDPKCPTSEDGVKKLKRLGYKNVIEFAGGIEAWKRQGYPVISTLEFAKAA